MNTGTPTVLSDFPAGTPAMQGPWGILVFFMLKQGENTVSGN
jgi:hypothetical protein